MDKTFNIATYIEALVLGLDRATAQPWLCVVLYLLSVGLIHRYTVIAFGSRQIGLLSICTFAVPLLLPIIDGYSIASWSFIALIVLEYAGDLQVSALNKRRHPLYTFNIGLLLSLLTFFHIGFLFLLPLFLFQIRHIEQREWRHYVALALGFLMLWWIYILFMAPAPRDIISFLLSLWRPLWVIELPKGGALLSTALLVLALLLSWWFSYINPNRMVQRGRIILQGRLWLSILLTLLHLLYCGAEGSMVFYSAALLPLLSTHIYYYSFNHRLQYLYQILLLLIVGSSLALRYVGLFN